MKLLRYAKNVFLSRFFQILSQEQVSSFFENLYNAGAS